MSSVELSGSDTEEEPTPPVEEDKKDTKEDKKETNADTSRKTKRQKVSEDLLCDALGLQRMYAEFSAACPYQGRGTETSFLKNVIHKYQEWSFQLCDKLHFEDVLNSIETLPSKARLRQTLIQLRDKERNRYIVSIDVLPYFCL